MKIKGVHCKSCKMLIEDVLSDINVKLISWKLNGNEATIQVDGNSSFEEIKKLIESEGDYKVEK
ncbi:heavy-metal-associated domain-containing protein [Candidatus Woesearchaeota archaeon]|jgi:copper chaperone CopZ|nr:heavy-metal-associated domain-containing protein [Candidatus Woesearchaeota archaeon]MBT4387914.1 heavy-metal-associated domain-containing protein [Candidatus Woesearchaeota archaeon]MBT4595732.1 heavy-metal-associated domain-containing protein [Candidatus Woesearchaeota archaeon]MBT5741419.1 heavy-metal-associated domain-containing protein [Candidatus Woesearchaeota archaeon]MBT6505557.1 heavy-metal-associated domain-containing protein [Candidatus Woesearchaeota archaeon]